MYDTVTCENVAIVPDHERTSESVVLAIRRATAIAAVPDLIDACVDVLEYLEERADDESNMLWSKVSAAVRSAVGA